VRDLAAVNLDQLFRWTNENQGVLALILFLLPALWCGIWLVIKQLNKKCTRREIAEEFAHAAKLKAEMEMRAEWEPNWGSYGEYLVRDADRRLPHTQENHSKEEAPHSLVVLTSIQKEHLEFTAGCNFAKYIKKVGDSWYFSDDNDEDAVLVEYIYWINYRDIVCIRWETDDYWEWPQVCCRFEKPKKFPFTKKFFGQRMTGSMPRPYYREICLVSEVSKLPHGLRKSRSK
jgi:hypothetical protein